MLERLLELFFHAKSGVFAGIFLIGTTGALVTATVSNGVTTITITQASASPSASASASPSASTSPSASPSQSPSASPSHSPSASPSASAPQEGSGSATCSAQAHEAAGAVQDVNSAFSALHTNLMHLRADAKAAKAIVQGADKELKEIRQSAVKAIHATNTCASGKDDEDNDEDEDNDDDDDNDSSSHESNFVVVLISNIQSFFGSHTLTVNNTTTTNTTFTGGPKDIADQAIAAMQQVFDDANAQLSELASPSPRATRSPKPSAHVDSNRSRDHGKSGHGDREGDDD